MEKKKGKRSRSKAATEDTSYKMMTLADVQARETMYSKLITDLQTVMEFVHHAVISTDDINAAQRLLEKWQTYIACEGLPKPYIPPDIRLFFEKLRHFESINVSRMMDWLLQVDERSILNQDIFRVDFTKKVLKRELRPNLGLEYDKNINLALRVHSSIQYCLKDLDMKTEAPFEVLMDIKELETTVGKEINGFFDRFTYRILSSEASNMEDVDAITAEYCFKGTAFQMHIWTLKNVPILFEFLPEPYLNANLHNLLCTVQIPYSILELNLTLRALHLDFDHYTKLARSFHQDIHVDTAYLNSGITDLAECLKNEWDMQVGLQRLHQDEMRAARSQYEQQMEEFQARMAELEKRNKDQKADKKPKKIHLPKPPKEVPVIEEHSYPDVRKKFIETEQDQFINFLNAVYGPDMLHLKNYEVNLKRFLMLGGIYQMDFVEKPINFNFENFNMTWHKPPGELHIFNDKVADPLAAVHHGHFAGKAMASSMSLVSEHALSRVLSVKSMHSVVTAATLPESKYFVVTFVLPKNLCLWGDPMVCHFEDNAYEFVHEDAQEQQIAQLQAKSLVPNASFLQYSLSFFNQTQDGGLVPAKTSIFGLPTVTHTQENFYQPSMEIRHGKYEHVYDGVPEPEIEDFELDHTLTKTNIRDLQTHALPRIISSYKFPNELREEESVAKAKKPKGQGGTLTRLKVPVFEDNVPKSQSVMAFDFGAGQNNPERIFPIFKVVRKLDLRDIESLVQPSEPSTFAELILMIEKIKKIYLESCLKTLLLPFYFPRMKYHETTQEQDDTEKRNSQHTRQSLGGRRKSTLNKRASRAYILDPEPSPSEHTLTPSEDGSGNKLDEDGKLDEGSTQEETHEDQNQYAHWTTEHIIESEFDRETSTMTVTTDRLGIFGFAFKRYEHFPFKYWSVEPNENNEIIVTIITQHVKVTFTVSTDGFRAYVTDPIKGFVRFPTIYLSIDEPLNDFRELRKRFREKNLNIFADNDARFYIENGYFSEKHLAAELHTYSCIALHCANVRFYYSDWNRLAKRREIMLKFLECKDTEDNMAQVRIEPEQCTFVEIKELCSDNLNDIRLEYTLTWRNVEHFSDLHQAIVSMYPTAVETRCQEPTLICNLKKLLWNVRPLSFS